MNTGNAKEGQIYICTKSDRPWWTVGKEYTVTFDIYGRPVLPDNDGYKWSSHYLNSPRFNHQFKLKEEQPKVTLDEPQKPVVPKFVAEWFEENKDDLEFLFGNYVWILMVLRMSMECLIGFNNPKTIQSKPSSA